MVQLASSLLPEGGPWHMPSLCDESTGANGAGGGGGGGGGGGAAGGEGNGAGPEVPNGNGAGPAADDGSAGALSQGLALPPHFPTSLSFVWNVPHFSSLSCLSMYSPSFTVNGHEWKIYIYPKGNNNHNRQLSVYLDSGITEAHDTLQCTFKLAVINYRVDAHAQLTGAPINAPASVVKESVHAFCKRAKDWGFREFMPLDQLEDPAAGFVNEGAVTLGVWIQVG